MPFDAVTVGDLCDRIGRVDYVPPAQVNPGVPREVSAIIARCLRKTPAERYHTAAELLADARKLTAAVSKPGVSPDVSDAAAEYAEAKASSGWKGLPLLIGAAAVAVVLGIVAVVAVVMFSSSADEVVNAGPAAPKNAANTARGLTSTPAPGATRDVSERTVEVTVNDGKADVYDGAEKLGTTPYAVRGKLGERVRLTLRRDGYADEPVDFVVGEKKAYMYSLSKK
jgi:hypothetical protein